MTFTPQFPTFESDPNAEPMRMEFFTSDYGSLIGTLGIDWAIVPKITMGIDTLGINSIIDYLYLERGDAGEIGRDLLNSLYLADTHLNEQKVMEDLPELEIRAGIDGLIKLILGPSFLHAYAQAGFDLNVDVALDLNDPDGDGKARILDLIDQTLDQGLTGLFDEDQSRLLIDANIGLGAGVELDLSESSSSALGFAATLIGWFGLDTKYSLDLNHNFPIPIYDSSKPGDGIFGL
jgi:hypothetical protein